MFILFELGQLIRFEQGSVWGDEVGARYVVQVKKTTIKTPKRLFRGPHVTKRYDVYPFVKL